MATESVCNETTDFRDKQRTEQISNLSRLLDQYIGPGKNPVPNRSANEQTFTRSTMPYSGGSVNPGTEKFHQESLKPYSMVTSDEPGKISIYESTITTPKMINVISSDESAYTNTQSQKFNTNYEYFPEKLQDSSKFQTQFANNDLNPNAHKGFQGQREGDANVIDIIFSTSDQIIDQQEQVHLTEERLTAESLKQFQPHPEYSPRKRSFYGQAFSPAGTTDKKNYLSGSKPQSSQYVTYSNSQESRTSPDRIYQNGGTFQSFENSARNSPQGYRVHNLPYYQGYSNQDANIQGGYSQQNEWIKTDAVDSNEPNFLQRNLKNITNSIQVSDYLYPRAQYQTSEISTLPNLVGHNGVRKEKQFSNPGKRIVHQSKLSLGGLSNINRPKLIRRAKSTEDLIEQNLQKLERSVYIKKIGEDQVEGVEQEHSFLLSTAEIETISRDNVYHDYGSQLRERTYQHSPPRMGYSKCVSADSEGKFLGGDSLVYEIVLEQYSDGSRYEGEKLLGKRHGKGTFYYKEGLWLDGTWEDGFISGYGTLWLDTNTKIYEGEWLKNVFHGRGTMYNHEVSNGNDFDGTDYRALQGGWIRFEGLFNSGVKLGLGTLVLANGDVFVGHFVRDVVDGRGSYTVKGQKAYVGFWKENLLVQKF